jgi:hypothetical protein
MGKQNSSQNMSLTPIHFKIRAMFVDEAENEKPLYSNHIQQVQSLSLPGHCARKVVSQWLLVMCFVDPKFVEYNLFYWWGRIHKGPCHELLYFTRVLVDENLYITVFSWHRFYINVQVGFLGDRLLGPFVCRNRLSRAVYPQWIGHGGLHDPLTLILRIFGFWNVWRLRCIQSRSVT